MTSEGPYVGIDVAKAQLGHPFSHLAADEFRANRWRRRLQLRVERFPGCQQYITSPAVRHHVSGSV